MSLLLSLRSLLHAHVPSDGVEASHRKRMIGLLESRGNPCSRGHFQPGHFTASAFVLSPAGKDLLLIYHGKLLRWLQPGGHIDPEDLNVVSAARRELREEAGIEIADLLDGGVPVLDLDVHAIPALRGEPAHEHFDVRIGLRARSRELLAGSDAQGARWVALEQVHTCETDDSVLRAVAKLERRRL